MEAWIDFGRGPLFRLAFSLMVLGLLRVVALTVIGIVESYRRNLDRIVPWKEVGKQTLAWLFPIGRLWRKRLVYSTVSLLFHIGLIVVPLFLTAHVLLWKRSVGFGWAPIPQQLANWLTLLAIVCGMGLFLGRVLHSGARALSRVQDLAWPLVLVLPFATGFICSNAAIAPKTYQTLMLVHVWSANLIMLMIPFTKIAHCVLAPLSQVVTSIAWKFPAGAGDRVVATLGYTDLPTWAPKSRLGREAR